MTQVLPCPECRGTDLARHGTTPEVKQRNRCRVRPERGRPFQHCQLNGLQLAVTTAYCGHDFFKSSGLGQALLLAYGGTPSHHLYA